MDFTDSNSERHNSSGKETYVIEQDYSDSSSSDFYPIHKNTTIMDLKGNMNNKDVDMQCQVINTISGAASTNLSGCIAQEIFTQTSKTIFELAQAERRGQTLETQTSYVSITENRTYKLEIKSTHAEKTYAPVLTYALEDQSSKFQHSDSDTFKSEENSSVVSSDDRIINILDAESQENVQSDGNPDNQYEHMSDFDETNQSDNSMDQDSLMEVKVDEESELRSVSEVSEIPKSIDDEIEDLYNKLTETRELHAKDREELEKRHRSLTPLTEESTIMRGSLVDGISEDKNIEESERDVVFTNFAGGKFKILSKDKEFKLPPIQNLCPNNPQLNFLFSVHPSTRLIKSGTLPCLYEARERSGVDRWEIDTKNLASGESALISGQTGRYLRLFLHQFCKYSSIRILHSRP